MILPTLDRIKNKIKIKTNIVDGSVKQQSQQEVFQILQSTDILLVGSKNVGTPLPVIEAVASGCAIISTNVGIVPEILPEKQQVFILNNVEEFVEAIFKLNNNRELLDQLKQDNYTAYQRIFMDSQSFIQKWSDFIESSIINSKKASRIKQKKYVLAMFPVEHVINTRISSRNIRKIANYLLQYTMFTYVIKKLYFFRKKIISSIYKIKNSFRKIFVKEEAVFSNIYATDFWTNASGPGSAKANTLPYRELLQQYFNDPKYTSYIDLGCGDWQIMKLINIPKEKTYKGYNIVQTVIADNQQKFVQDNVKLYYSTNINQINSGDLLIVKDVLMHWPNKRVHYFINHILPKFKYALITEGYDKDKLNKDIHFGEWSLIDITAPPFNLQNVEKILKYGNNGEKKIVYLFSNPKIKWT